MDSSIQPFYIKVPDAKLESLHVKLSHTSFSNEVPIADSWDYGPPLSDLKRLVSYWKDGFDWRAAEARINKHQNFKTPISVDGFGDLNIHFIHKTSDRKGSIPLLFCHGCRSPMHSRGFTMRLELTCWLQGP